MAKKQGIDPKASTAARIRRTEAYAEKVRLLFAQTVNEILALNKTMPKLDDGVMFSFDGESMKKQKEVEALLRRLHSSVTMAIREGVSLEWAEANAEADKLIKSVFGQAVLDSPEFTAWTQRNTAARDAFLARSEKGLNLSDRVWKSVRQLRDELEVAVTVSMGEGKSASAMSREVRQYLNDPDLMFRRFRYKKGEDKDGNPVYGRKWKKRVKDEATGKYKWIDYDRDSYKTGAGVYKSSAKNAMRLTRSETNIAYRRADHERWMQEDFVVGQRIRLSNNHPEKDICDKLQGDYPKEFVFDGWHPQCFCYAVPITIADEDTDFMEKWFLEGKDWEGELKRRAEARMVRDYPAGFKEWVAEHADDIKAARQRGTEPYFIRNNAEIVDRFMGVNGGNGGGAGNAKSAQPKQVAQTSPIDSLFTTRKTFEGGGSVKVMEGVDKDKPDYKDILSIATLFAKEGKEVKILARTHYKSPTYAAVFASLIGTNYERKCPDILVDEVFYEYESYKRPWNKRKISNMLSHGLQQSDRVIIDNNKGASDRYIRKAIIARLRIDRKIKEVWIYEKGQLRLFYKDGEFVKNNGGK